MRVDQLVELADREQQNYVCGELTRPQFAYELFRRAIDNDDSQAWGGLRTVYDRQLRVWLYASSLFDGMGVDEAVSDVWVRFWYAVRSKSADEFVELLPILAYLKRTTLAHLRDIRKCAGRRPPSISIEASHECVSTTVTCTLRPMENDIHMQQDLWQVVATMLHGENEQLVVDLQMRQGMTPQMIARQTGNLSAKEVSRTKLNIIKRLRRKKHLFAEFFGD